MTIKIQHKPSTPRTTKLDKLENKQTSHIKFKHAEKQIMGLERYVASQHYLQSSDDCSPFLMNFAVAKRNGW